MKSIRVLAFGKVADVMACRELTITGPNDTDGLARHLEETYPGMKSTAYTMAVDRKMIRQNSPLDDGAEVALLPPFSGG